MPANVCKNEHAQAKVRVGPKSGGLKAQMRCLRLGAGRKAVNPTPMTLDRPHSRLTFARGNRKAHLKICIKIDLTR
jgi:hypothetical protein